MTDPGDRTSLRDAYGRPGAPPATTNARSLIQRPAQVTVAPADSVVEVSADGEPTVSGEARRRIGTSGLVAAISVCVALAIGGVLGSAVPTLIGRLSVPTPDTVVRAGDVPESVASFLVEAKDARAYDLGSAWFIAGTTAHERCYGLAMKTPSSPDPDWMQMGCSDPALEVTAVFQSGATMGSGEGMLDYTANTLLRVMERHNGTLAVYAFDLESLYE